MTVDEIAAPSDPGPAASDAPHRWPATVAATVLGVTVFHLAALIGNRGPVLYSDALGYFGNARYLAGGAPPTFDGSFSYSAGYSILLVPFYWITERSNVIWTLAVALNVGLAVLIMVPAYVLARRVFDLNRNQALMVSVAVSLTPALLLQPGRGWVETLFPFVFLAATVAVHTMFRTRKISYAVSSGALVGYLVFIHGRGLAVVAAFLVVLVVGTATRRLAVRAALAASASVTFVVVVDLLLRSYLKQELWSASQGPANAGSVSRVIRAYTPDQLGATLTTGLGHLWYVIAVSFGIAAVGLIALVLVARGNPRWSPPKASEREVALFAILSVVGVAILSAGLLTEVNRVDHRVYGRYLEGVTPILILAGSAWLLKARSAWRLLVAGALLIPAAGFALYAGRDASDFVGNVQKFAIPGLLGLQSIVDPSDAVFLKGLSVVAISLLAAGMGVATALVVRGRPSFGVVAAIVLTLGVTFVGKTTSWDPFVLFWFEAYDNVPRALQVAPEDRSVGYDFGFLDPDARNLYEFRFAPHHLTFVNDACGAVPGDALISSSDLGRVGVVATLIAVDSLPDQGLWLVEETIPIACQRR